MLRSTARVWNPQGISKLMNKVDCWVPCALLKVKVWAFLSQNPLQRDPQRTPAILQASQSQFRRMSYLRATFVPNGTEAPWM
jgi:hypothetical protein